MPKVPEEVFTPRSPDVNESMYIKRPELENALARGLRGGMHLLLYGDSGSGKSWLYKKVLKELQTPFEVANLANASRLGSISAEFQNLIDRTGHSVRTGFSEEKSAGIKIPVAHGNLRNLDTYNVGRMESVEAALAFLAERASGSRAVLVLDNLEAAFENRALMEELADLIILLDDARYAQYAIKFLIVGVPRGVREYFARTPNRRTVSNRIQELPEVARLRKGQVSDLVFRGFRDELQFDAEEAEMKRVAAHVHWVTSGVPQQVHEYCLQLAFMGEHERAFPPDALDLTDASWLHESFADCYDTVDATMNVRETKAGRRNQTLYALGRIESDEFKAPDLEAVVRKEFPTSTDGKGLNIGGILSDLAGRPVPIVQTTMRGDGYRFADPRYRMTLRAMLRKEEAETVRRIEMESFGES